MKSTVPKVQEIFEAAKCQESLVENLPNVPNTDEFFDDQNSVDEDIEARLCKLKFFRKTWCSAETSDRTEPEEVIAPVVTKISEPKRNADVVNVIPIYSTKEEAEMFNDWYLKRIGAISIISSDTFDVKNKAGGEVSEVQDFNFTPTVLRTQLLAEVGSKSPEQDRNIDENPNIMPGVIVDKEVDHAMSLSNPHTSNLFEGPTSVHSNISIVNMLVLFFTTLKLIHFTKPNFSYVPAVFTTLTPPSLVVPVVLLRLPRRRGWPCPAVRQ